MKNGSRGLIEMDKRGMLEIVCNDFECFSEPSRTPDCARCDEGELYLYCSNCGHQYEIKDSLWRRIDCEDCDTMIIPCAYTKYIFTRKDALR